ncbi:MAG: hypothetical protein HKN44_00965 [Ilumatobacter sp.]|nr:hypothetical protein [Ilumatobacter sp.]
MTGAAVFERLEQVIATRADAAAPLTDVRAALAGVRDVRSFLASVEADLTRRVAAAASFPEADVAESSKGSLHDATATLDRAATLESVPGLAGALEDATVTAGHVDAVTKAAKRLDDDRQRSELFDRVDALVDVAEVASVAEFGRRVRDEASRILAAAGVDRLARQMRDASLSSWVGNDGMWNLRGRFDPVTGM